MDELLPALQQYAPAGYEFRLPSEAEWEYACRAGTAAAYHTGDGQEALDAAGWFLSNSNRKVQPIGGKSPNAFGLFDSHGNVGGVLSAVKRGYSGISGELEPPRRQERQVDEGFRV